MKMASYEADRNPDQRDPALQSWRCLFSQSPLEARCKVAPRKMRRAAKQRTHRACRPDICRSAFLNNSISIDSGLVPGAFFCCKLLLGLHTTCARKGLRSSYGWGDKIYCAHSLTAFLLGRNFVPTSFKLCHLDRSGEICSFFRVPCDTQLAHPNVPSFAS